MRKRSRARTFAVVVLGSSAVAVAAVVVPLAVQAITSPQRVANQIVDVHANLDDGNYEAVHDSLCAARRAEVTVEDIERTHGEVISPFLVRPSWGGTPNYMDDPADTDPTLTTVTKWSQAQRVTGPGREFVYEDWYITLVLEDRSWKLCSFELADTYPLVDDYETVCTDATDSMIKGCPGWVPLDARRGRITRPTRP